MMSRLRKRIIAGMLSLPFFAMAAERNTVFETSFTSSKVYENPFTELEIDVLFSNGKQEWKVPAFWDGGRTWKIRFSAPEKGEYSYREIASGKSNEGLNTEEKTPEVTEYTGGNPINKRGKYRVTEDQRFFEFSDVRPFFWLGDTWWKGLCKRLSFRSGEGDRRRRLPLHDIIFGLSDAARKAAEGQ